MLAVSISDCITPFDDYLGELTKFGHIHQTASQNSVNNRIIQFTFRQNTKKLIFLSPVSRIQLFFNLFNIFFVYGSIAYIKLY